MILLWPLAAPQSLRPVPPVTRWSPWYTMSIEEQITRRLQSAIASVLSLERFVFLVESSDPCVRAPSTLPINWTTCTNTSKVVSQLRVASCVLVSSPGSDISKQVLDWAEELANISRFVCCVRKVRCAPLSRPGCDIELD